MIDDTQATGLSEEVIEFLAEYLKVDKAQLCESTQLGEDLGIVGDDAEELLEDFERRFQIDTSSFDMAKHFPREASSAMHLFLARRREKNASNWVVRAINRCEQRLWRLLSGDIRYRSLRVVDLQAAAASRKLENQ